MSTSYKIEENLYLVKETFKTTKKKPAPPPVVNHILCIDCSGSMYSDLPRIRQQLKNKLPKLLGENDTISVVWFSGRGQFGTLIEGERVGSLTDLQSVNAAIDRWLRTVGLTGFKEPLIEVSSLVQRVQKTNPGAFSLIFMSDGYDNQWRRDEILKAMQQAAGQLSATTVVEYGYYADRSMLTAMAETAGGQLIFSEDFDRYDVDFEKAIQSKVASKKVEIQLPDTEYVGGIAWCLENGLVAYGITGTTIQVPEGTESVFFLSNETIGTLGEDMTAVSKAAWGTPAASGMTSPEEMDALYAGISLFATRMRPEIVRPLLRASGDVAFIEQFAQCFGKQKYSDFMEATKEAAFSSANRFQDGWDPTRVPRDDAFTVLDLLQLLNNDDKSRVLLADPLFQYNRIGRSRVDANLVLTPEEEEELDELRTQLAGTKDVKKIAKISARITEISDKPAPLQFLEDTASAEEGVPISNLTLNENRPNISILVKKLGTVDLSTRKDKPKSVPNVIDTFVYRNYTVIRDGMINIKALPMRVSEETASILASLLEEGRIRHDAVEILDTDNSEILVYLDKMPVVNALMVQKPSAEELFRLQYQTIQYKSEQKVYNTRYKELFPGQVRGDGWKELYGEDAVAWLKEQGLTEYNGFSPKSRVTESTDFYMGKELKVKMKGLSSIPTIKDVRAIVSAGKKLNAAADIVASYLDEADDLIQRTSDKDLEAKLTEAQNEITQQARRNMFEIAKTKFAVILGQTWFEEFETLDENSMDVTMSDGRVVHCEVEQKEIEIKI